MPKILHLTDSPNFKNAVKQPLIFMTQNLNLNFQLLYIYKLKAYNIFLVNY